MFASNTPAAGTPAAGPPTAGTPAAGTPAAELSPAPAAYPPAPGPAGARRSVVDPRRIALGAVIALCCVLAGVGVGVFCIVTSVGKLPAPTAEFPADRPADVTLDHGGGWTIYGDRDDLAPSRNTCTVRTTEGTSVPTATHRVRVQTDRNGHDWVRVASFTADAAGRYTVECRSDQGVTRFAVAEASDVKGFTIWLVAGILGMLTLTGGGILTGVVVGTRARTVVGSRTAAD